MLADYLINLMFLLKEKEMMYTRGLFLSLVVAIVFVLVGCSSVKVKRVDVQEKIDLSGTFNDYDAMLVSKEMVTDSLSRVWRENFITKNGRNPIVIVGEILNKSHEHIDEDIFIKALEKELINSGKIIFVASSAERMQIRDERKSQQEYYTSKETIKKFGEELGADFMLSGSINSIKDEIKGQYAILYQVNLELIDVSTNQKVWVGQKEIKKHVKMSKIGM